MADLVIDVGDAFRATATFRNAAGALTDPSTVALDVELPDGTALAYSWAGGSGGSGTLTRESTGVYRRVISATVAGSWRLRWSGTGTVQQASRQIVYVNP